MTRSLQRLCQQELQGPDSSRSFRRPFAAFKGAVVCVLFLSGCAPTFSDLQSARLAGPGRWEVTPSYSATYWAEDGETEKVQDHVGIQVASGINERTDLRVRAEFINVSDGVGVLGAGPKFSIVQDRLAFFAPLGFAFGSGIEVGETVQVQPTFLYTVSDGRHVELTAGAKALLWLDRDNEDLLAANLGLGLSSDLSKWVLRPEIGFLKDPGEEGQFLNLSLGLTFFGGPGESR